MIVDRALARGGVPGIGLESAELLVSVFPEAGGKVLDLVHRPTGLNLLWQNPRVPLVRGHAGAPFEDVWCGGFDELFPTDAACTVDGNAIHDHGDLWIGPWECAVTDESGDSATLQLRRFSPSLPCLVEKWLTLAEGRPELRARYRLTNVGPRPIAFVFSLHVAHALEPGSVLHLPASRIAVEPPYVGRPPLGATDHPWPGAAGKSDLSRLPGPESGLTEWLWTRELADGWCAVSHPERGVGLELAFDRSVFPTVWLFGVYGGWRGHHFLLTEPATGPPGSLATAIESGTAATLAPGAVLETEVVATVYGVAGPSPPGDVRPLAPA
ncbi:MAG: hypothetical protein IT201_08855 [Thermoleophilia bacterium]|nr:hypothetical protein [Thermoleophilia bacterium]